MTTKLSQTVLPHARRHRVWPAMLLGFMFASCGGRPALVAESSASSATQGEASVTSDASEVTDDSGEATAIFGPQPDYPDQACGEPCDIWDPLTCAEGQACTAFACADASATWDANVCRDVLGDKQVGEACVGPSPAEDDDCAAGLMCWRTAADTEFGECVAFCEGSPGAPECDQGFLCSVFNDGVMPLCLESCDPLVQDCASDELCLPEASAAGFVCLPGAGGVLAGYGGTCQFTNGCDVGLLCIAGERVPEAGCGAGSDCCSPYCDVNSAIPCPGAGQVCEPLFTGGAGPSEFQQVGVCAVPG